MLLTIHVIPRSKRNTLEWAQKGEAGTGTTLKAHITAAPVDGAANEALVTLLATHLALPRRSIQIVRGVTSRTKTIAIANLSLEDIQQRLLHSSTGKTAIRSDRI